LGYACGFASSILDREIIFREVSCRGCGQDKCLIVGKPAEEWEDADQFRKYFNVDSIIEELYELHSQIDVLRNDLYATEAFGDSVGSSDAFKQVCQLADKASNSNVSILLTGETGVGKEVMARRVHLNSQRVTEPFVAVNCATIPPDLIEDELFGVEKGAFTGASHSRKGRFERADKGTIFLDEVVELSPRAQAALLRVLQEGELERVGDDKTRKVDVRLIAATNESLEEAVKTGRFRADLFYRLNVFPVEVPPLRARKQDIPLLAEHFVKKYEVLHGKRTLGFSSRAMNALMAYGWPGNIRELENVVERGIILAENRCHIESSQLFRYIEECEECMPGAAVSDDGSLAPVGSATDKQLVDQLLDADFDMEQLENDLMAKALEKSGGNVTKAAKLLGLSRPALDYRLKKSGIGKS
jgi:transcriptional regulator with GAF, ATPase, and Fis domain